VTIRVLEQTVAAKIAAGEVVERPASVVKELVENSLDAGVTQISVESRGGGVSLIRVTDNGSGIPPGDVETAFDRYATSKVSTVEDLDSIVTFGFRGEALPSIAAVAVVEIATCVAGESAGDFVSLQNGAVVEHRSEGHARGTTVTVRDLFRSVPARLKFLKSTATENSHIARVVSEYALAFPEVRFSLTIDGRSVLRTPGTGHLIESAIEVYGLQVARDLLDIKGSDDTWQGGNAAASPVVTGMVGSPGLSRSNRDYLSFFVNRRSISNRSLSWAVEEAYQGMLMTGRHPIAIVNIAIPPGEVDVNIHPAKAEVKFRNERAVFTAVQRAVRGTLVEMAPLARMEDTTATYTAPPASTRRLWDTVPTDASTTPLPLETAPTPSVSLPALRVLGQLDSTYIIAEGPDGLYLIDQHAAHERIVYEKARRQQEQHQTDVQGLLEPVPFEVSPRQDEVLRNGYRQLEGFGFSIEPFGDRTYLVRAIPAVLDGKDWPAMVRELLDTIIGGGRDNWSEDIAVTLACHSAVRAGQTLSDDEMRELIRQLEQTAMPRTCPHGRPTVIHMSSRQLEKEFGLV
jgi:DNA mismatch repair protein MutL